MVIGFLATRLTLLIGIAAAAAILWLASQRVYRAISRVEDDLRRRTVRDAAKREEGRS